MAEVLVINSGSSSVKYELFDMDAGRSLTAGQVERIGRPEVPDHNAAMRVALDALGLLPASAPGDAGVRAPEPRPETRVSELGAVGHRVVHGGDRFEHPVLIDDEVVRELSGLSLLAPLHTSANIAGIEATRRLLPDVPQVAVFDTTFHLTIPARACEYALPRELTRAHGIRRYGFHGTSHAYVSRRAAELLARPLESLNLISFHLGNGASAAAIQGGRSIDTSMGMTPLEGLVMGTRCGDIDPAIPLLIRELTGASREDVHRLMNEESGLKGLCGESDMREVHSLADSGDADARLALDMFCYRAKKYLGAYLAVLGHVHAIVFTGGIGENDAHVRARICEGLAPFGIVVDDARNRAAHEDDEERAIHADDSEVAVLVVPTDEEREIARITLECLQEETADRETLVLAQSGGTTR